MQAFQQDRTNFQWLYGESNGTTRAYGRGGGVGLTLGVACGLAVGVGLGVVVGLAVVVGVELALGVAVAVGVELGVAVAVGVPFGVGLGVGVGVPVGLLVVFLKTLIDLARRLPVMISGRLSPFRSAAPGRAVSKPASRELRWMKLPPP
jgi:hypothetical protein